MFQLLRLLWILPLISLLQTSAWAQGTGSVTGIVSDETGGVLPGVAVELKPADSRQPLETVTDGAGSYRFDNVPAGPAELTIRLINFSMVRRNVSVTSGAAVQANAVMLVAASADIVVTAPRTFRNLAEIENPAEILSAWRRPPAKAPSPLRSLPSDPSTGRPKFWRRYLVS